MMKSPLCLADSKRFHHYFSNLFACVANRFIFLPPDRVFAHFGRAAMIAVYFSCIDCCR